MNYHEVDTGIYHQGEEIAFTSLPNALTPTSLQPRDNHYPDF